MGQIRSTLKVVSLATVLCCFTAVNASAQDISSAVGRLPVGTVITYKNSDGPYFTHVVRGKDARGYRIDIFEGRTPEGPEKSVYWVDGKGNLLRFELPNGDAISYKPSDCVRTLGTCKFTEMRSGEPGKAKVRITTKTADGFEFEEKDAASGATLKVGETTVGPNGLNVRSWYRRTGEGRIELKIVKIDPPS